MSPIQTQLVELPWGQGLETKQDATKIPLGKLIALSNATFNEPGRLQKRNGYAALTQSILGGGSIGGPSALFERQGELLQTAGTAEQSLYSYSANAGAWVSKGLMPSIGASISSSAQPQYSTYCIDMAVAPNGLQCFVYELIDTNNSLQRKGIGYTVVDPATGQVVVPPGILETSTTAGSPRVIVLGGNFVCYYIIGVIAVSASLLGRTLSNTNPLAGWSASTALTSGTTTLALAFSPFNFDSVSDATSANGYLIFENRSGSTTIMKVTTASPLVLTVAVTVGAAGLTPTIFMDLNGNVIMGIDGIPAKFAVFDTSLNPVKTLTNLSGSSGGAMTGVSTSPGAFTLFYCVSNTISTNSVGGVTYGTITGSSSPITISLGIAAKAFAINGVPYLPAWFCFNTSAGGFTRFNTPQNSLYLIDVTGRVLSKALTGTTGGYETISLFNVVGNPTYQLGSTVVANSTATFPASNSNVIESNIVNSRFGLVNPVGAQLLLNYNYGAAAVSLTFGDSSSGRNLTNIYQRAQLAQEVHTNGGVLQMYDGQQVVEHGFLVYPYFINVSTAGGGGLSAGSYQVVATYEWMDGQGQVHRSTPSIPVSFTATAGQSATYVTPTLALTAKTGVVVQYYRTLVNGSIFFQVTNFNNSGTLYNNPAVATASWVDAQSDAAISGNPQLYTTGGVLQNDPVNPAGAMTVHRNRLFVVDSTNPTQIWYSQQVVPPAPVEFSGFLILNVDPKGGPVTALASLDDKLIVFKADRIFMFLGQGPDSLGNQNDFTDAILVNADTGCVVPKSIVVTPDGLMYQSPKGIYQLSRALQVSYIGAPVEQLVPSSGPSISASLLRPNSNQIYFVITGGQTFLEYDYLVDQWSSFPISVGPVSLVDSVMFNGLHCILTSNGVKQETLGLYSDPFGDLTKSLTTGWIKLSGLQGFQRARRLWFLGAWRGAPHVLSISVAYDYKSALVQDTDFEVLSDPGPYQFMVHLAQQKCEAIQITVTEQYVSGQPGETADWVGMQLEVGVKKGGKKLGAVSTGG